MAYQGEERRKYKRSYIEPYDTSTLLEVTLGDKEYRFKLLDTSPGGMGMLVLEEEADVLKKLNVGDQIKMKYGTPQVSAFMNFQITHITLIMEGVHKGNYLVGLSLFLNSG
jgi:c-di-GMP-binding flagellar brake protein YcgR